MKVYDLWECPSCDEQDMVWVHDDMVIPPICGVCSSREQYPIEMEEVK